MDTKLGNWGGARKQNLLVILALLLLEFHLHVSSVSTDALEKVYIVYMGGKKYEDSETTKKSHHQMLSTSLGSKQAAKSSILYSYKHGFSGFAARLTESQAFEIGNFPGVVHVIPNRIHKLHTTRSWDFIGLSHHFSQNILAEGNMGKGTIIGVIDTGVWPESESFEDRNMGPIPSHWRGICQEGQHFNSSNCNRKLIGARWFVKGLRAEIKRPINTTDNEDFLSPRDGVGHGTHTASTAAGNFVEKANYRGLAQGTARGGAPLAHLAIYKACWGIATGGCTDADLLKAFDKAIEDGVDIISLSVGSGIPLFSYVDQRNSIAIGSFHATANGITVVCSGGNDGPKLQTIENTAPWIITVAATTIDRAFPTAITLGNHKTVWGESIDTVNHNQGFTGLTYSERIAVEPEKIPAMDCQDGSLNATLAAGKIILCFSASDTQDIASASISVHNAGGIGLIFAESLNDGLASCNLIPCIKVDFEVGTQILSYIRRTRSPSAKLSFPKSVIGRWESPKVATFSSRGPNTMTPTVLKPDIAAPGVDILAAYPPADPKHSSGYALQSGTSMACPHVAGIAALLKSVHRNWSPAAIRSALVTTASQTGTSGNKIFEDGSTIKAADPFDIGGGHVDPKKAMDPGLIYDTSTEDYIQFLCSTGYSNTSITHLMKNPRISCMGNNNLARNLNLPSIAIPNLKRKVTITRKVRNVGCTNSIYKAIMQAPNGIKMIVKPKILNFSSTIETLTFQVTFSTTGKVYGGYKFGSLVWTDGEHVVRSPIAIRSTILYPNV
ncbi:subtilisin-like protease SBT3.9 isoform X2 [Tripterygium wilfordii]|uniref:subtilisin-like protease SBT3.9 isoform X2 n=1 Tax=Tripterygium wilfordii TaxID=458696 RepID=UPI0018F817AF|nr:subtilisin-like protease SBT3.9 isoform X2 [Tripterygium wilfordii]